jgi:hypothetical protein
MHIMGWDRNLASTGGQIAVNERWSGHHVRDASNATFEQFDHTWALDDRGLILPLSIRSHPARHHQVGENQRPDQVDRERAQPVPIKPAPLWKRFLVLAPEWMQAFGAIATIPIALWALVVALGTAADQQAVSSDQLKMNQQLRDQADRVYASKVSFWADVDSDMAIFKIQNPAPVPLKSTWLIFDYYDLRNQSATLAYRLPDLPPCTLLSVRLNAPVSLNEWRVAHPDTSDKPLHSRLLFAESSRSWVFAETGVLSKGASDLSKPHDSSLDVDGSMYVEVSVTSATWAQSTICGAA